MTYALLAREAGHVHVCGHRGHSIGTPENTIAAIEAAAEHGATVAEIDVVLSADDEIFVMHDTMLDRTTDGRGPVGALSSAEIRGLNAGRWFAPRFQGTGVPDLGEALETARARGMGLLVEIKERRRAGRMIERLARFMEETDAFEDIVVISFDHPSLFALRNRLPAIRTEIITHARHIALAEIALRAGAASVAIEADMFDPRDAADLHAAGVAVRVTVPVGARLGRLGDDGAAMMERVRQAVSEGLVDCVAADDVAAAADLVRSARGSGLGSNGLDTAGPILR